jgi:hypothetical protein
VRVLLPPACPQQSVTGTGSACTPWSMSRQSPQVREGRGTGHAQHTCSSWERGIPAAGGRCVLHGAVGGARRSAAPVQLPSSGVSVPPASVLRTSLLHCWPAHNTKQPTNQPGATCANGENNTFDEDTCLVLPEWAIRSGPREKIYFDPEKV